MNREPFKKHSCHGFAASPMGLRISVSYMLSSRRLLHLLPVDSCARGGTILSGRGYLYSFPHSHAFLVSMKIPSGIHVLSPQSCIDYNSRHRHINIRSLTVLSTKGAKGLSSLDVLNAIDVIV